MKVIKILFLCVMFSVTCYSQIDQPTKASGDTVYINMAALDQPFMYNRLGTAQPTGMIFALESDIVAKDRRGKISGNVKLKEGKRPRPIVLRANVGDVLVIKFTNYLRKYVANEAVPFYPGHPTQQDTVVPLYPVTRDAGVHIVGTELVKSINDDASNVGSNQSSLCKPGQTRTYTLFAGAEGTFVLHSTADNIADGTIRAGQISNGLFGSLIVEPPQAEWYRSQVTEQELYDATTHWIKLDKQGRQTKVNKPKNASIEFKQSNKGFPMINYNATKRGKPILKMYKQIRKNARELIATDLTAMITGPNAGDFPESSKSPSFLPLDSISRDRRQPYREFSIHYHEAPYAVQAFPAFYDNSGPAINNLTQTIQGGVDQFAFNYGTGGIGAEIYANRVGVGPMHDCVECAYEEFFLSAWAVSDPAQVVDIPSNATAVKKKTTQTTTDEKHINAVLQDLMLREAALLGNQGTKADPSFIDKEIRATKAYYPDDPSNVYHSYMNDHVKFRINHCGAGITHVHHQHAHQWLHSPNSDDGHYLDSQTINPGASYTLEIVYGGSGNLNKTVGDQIFHCHFYPHFAQGMWAMWRVHDVLETGTVLDRKGNIPSGSRAYPDGEIAQGTPIPGLVPISTIAMAPVPGRVSIKDGQIELTDKDASPGYPFYIPGVAGQRPPAPPLDFAVGDVVTESGKEIKNTELNGGLPRNVVYDGEVFFENHTIYDWTKIAGNLMSVKLPEDGTYYEKLAMQAHATRKHPTISPNGKTGDFILNGRPPVGGAPFADPAVTWNGAPVGTKRVYKAANIQVDAVLNELGWHYPQQRPIVLWGDVAATISGDRPPQPFFFRANSDEYIEYWHTNLVPEYYELDDFQVRTPTDIIGQHIHLVKFDVTSSDGAANGWNYQDGTLAAGTVREKIRGINEGKFFDTNLGSYFSGSIVGTTIGATPLSEKLEPYRPMEIWGDAPVDQNWLGAQTTIQRWFANPLYNNELEDRTLRTVFTHDHYGPSTHQQIGLYAGLLIEPKGSKWLNSSTGTPLGFATLGETRKVSVDGKSMEVSDGGPTNWQAIIQTEDEQESYREFMFEFQDNQQAYLKESKDTLNKYPDFNPPSTTNKKDLKKYVAYFRHIVNTQYTGWKDPAFGINIPTQPELVTTGNRGTLSVNYRNSPVPIRVAPGNKGGESTNLAYAFSSNVQRNETALNFQPEGKTPIRNGSKFIYPRDPLGPGMLPTDPYTPLGRAYAGDRIQVRTLVGSHVNPHFFNIHGVKWYFEPSFENSGFRSTQMMSISEHFEMNFRLPYAKGNSKGVTDYLYKTNADDTGIQAGTFGFLRSYNKKQRDLHPMPNNKFKKKIAKGKKATGCGCPEGAEIAEFDVSAISIDKYNIGGPNWGYLTYNEQHRNFDSKAMLFIKTDEVDDFMSTTGYEPKPLVLRVKAGDCIRLKLRNKITPGFINNTNSITYVKNVPGTKQPNTTYDYETSYTVGMHAELVNYDVSQNDGAAAGQNTGKFIGQEDGFVEYEWYAGQWSSNGILFEPEAVELGTCVLTAPDPLLQYVSGLFGALIVEPEGSFWVEDQNNPTSANVYASENDYRKGAKPMFREFVMMFQDNLNVGAEPIGDITGVAVNGGLNYKSEPLANRVFFDAEGTINFNSVDVSNIVSNHIVLAAPETPTFVSGAKTPLRLRVMYAGGVGDGTTFDLHGHVWQELPYINESKKLGFNVESQWQGARGQLGALNAFDLLINSAGGVNGVTGDYLYRDYRNQLFQEGIWGVMKVTNGEDAPIVTSVNIGKKGNPTTYTGENTVNPSTGKYAAKVVLSKGKRTLAEADVNQFNGKWEATSRGFRIVGGLTVTSMNADGSRGGSVSYTADQVRQLTTPSQERVKMPKTKRSAAKQIEPGSNKGALNLKARKRR